jgi:hypothetical protein
MEIQNDGIIPILSGGLGNNLFILSTALLASKKLEFCPIYLFYNDPKGNKHNKLLLNYNKLLFNEICIELQKENEIKLKQDYVYHEHTMKNGLLKYDINSIKTKMILYSYYQYYPPICDEENYIRDIFNKKCFKSFRERVKNDLCEFNLHNCAFLHIRRGDYLEYEDVYYIPSMIYYKTCCEEMLKNNKVEKIFILSNDIEFVKKQNYFFENKKFYIYENDNEIEALSLMSLCLKGSICSNSTFSWWGAFLGAYKYRNDVFIPKNWIKLDIDDLFPKEWKQI